MSKPKDCWLDGIPHKKLVWLPLYDTLRLFCDDVTIADELEERLFQLDRAARLAQDEPMEIINQRKEALVWLQERLT